MRTECNKCVHGSVNFWGYDECWKYDKELDMETTEHTAKREKDVSVYNHNHDCINYDKKP